ncbi:endonuclease/exonuclease/phosphatase family protein [bacterium]|nr:endonuclease/exonuclease/phosphatase family protein [bacterium]
MSDPGAASGIVVATYNVHRCVGRDGRKDPRRVAEAIRDLGAEVVGLQEVENRQPIQPPSQQLNYLAERLEMTAIPGPTLFSDEGDYGNGLLTRHPVLSVRHIDISRWRREPRGILCADIDVRGTHWRFLLTHFGLRSWERWAQMRLLVDIAIHDEGVPTVVLGDLNEWLRRSRNNRLIERSFGPSPMFKTYPAHRPIFSLDRILAAPPARIAEIRAVTNERIIEASDHLPIVAKIVEVRGEK